MKHWISYRLDEVKELHDERPLARRAMEFILNNGGKLILMG